MRVFTKGDRVTQPTYGAGTVTDANERHTVIEFDEHGTRTFMTALVTLEATDEPAPPGRARASKGGKRSSRKQTPSA